MDIGVEVRTRALKVFAQFLGTLRQIKGPVGAVALQAFHWKPEAGESQNRNLQRDIAARKKVITSAAVKPDGDRIKGTFDGELSVGELVQFEARLPERMGGGYVHIFDFGTSGTVMKLGPSEEHSENYVESGGAFTVPSAKICPMPPHDCWIVGRPLSVEFGTKERMLVLVTKDFVGLQLEDLHEDMNKFGRDLYSRCVTRSPLRERSANARGASSREPEDDDEEMKGLFALDPDRYEYGLLELNVVA